MKSLRGKTVYFWWSASSVVGVTFTKWVSMRMGTGREDTNRLGTGALVKSDWLFNKEIVPQIPRGLKRGQYKIRPFTELYRTYAAAQQRKRAIKRPLINK